MRVKRLVLFFAQCNRQSIDRPDELLCAISKQNQDYLNTSVSLMAPEMQHSHSKSISQPFFFTFAHQKGRSTQHRHSISYLRDIYIYIYFVYGRGQVYYC